MQNRQTTVKNLRNSKVTKLRKENRQEKFSMQRDSERQVLEIPLLDISKNPLIIQLLSFDNNYLIEKMAQCIKDLNLKRIRQKIHAIIALNQIAKHNFMFLVQKIDKSSLLKVIQCARQQRYSQLQSQAVDFLKNIANIKYQHLRYKQIMNEELLSFFIKILISKNTKILELSFEAITNIASNSSEARNKFIQKVGFSKIIQLFKQYQDSPLFAKYCMVLSNLCRHDPLPKHQQICELIPLFCKIIIEKKQIDHETLSNCCWAIYKNCESYKANVVLKTGVLSHLLNYLPSIKDQLKVIVPVLKIIGNLGDFHPSVSKNVLTIQNIAMFQEILLSQSDNNQIRNQTIILLRKLSNGKQQVKIIIKSVNLIKNMINLLKQKIWSNTHYLICQFIIKLIINGDSQQLFVFFRQFQMVNHIYALMQSTQKRIVNVAFNCLTLILISGQKFKSESGNEIILQLRRVLPSLLQQSRYQTLIELLKNQKNAHLENCQK